MTSKKESISLKKIVYFDEGSAIDYLDITDGGLKKNSEEANISKTTELTASVSGSVGTGLIIKALGPFLKLKADGEAGAGISRIGESFVRTIISNTVLSDYLEHAEEDPSIKKIEGYKIEAFPESISFIKMYTPYFSMLKMDNEAVNISKIDEVLEKGKGYYELIADNGSDSDKIVLRFNFKAFRNNYSLVDLTKMELRIYAIEVGKMNIVDLNIKKEFPSIGSSGSCIVEDIISSSNTTSASSKEENNDSKVYDVILAGVCSNE